MYNRHKHVNHGKAYVDRKLIIVRSFKTPNKTAVDSVQAYAICMDTDGTTDGTDYHVVKSYFKAGALRPIRRDIMFTTPSYDEAYGYVMNIATHKREHYAHAYTNNKSLRAMSPIAQGTNIPETRKERKRRNKKTQALRETQGKLAALHAHGYKIAAPDLPQGSKETYADDVTAWSREKRRETELRAVFRKYGYDV